MIKCRVLVDRGILALVSNELHSYQCVPKRFDSFQCFELHRVRKRRGHVIFDYKSRISWWMFIIFIPLETGMNTPLSYVVYLLDGLMTS